MSNVPSLKALRAFEAAARTGSFAAAAEELSVSSAAIGQLVRGLEDQIGRQLFHRSHRSINPTEAGLEVLPRLSNAFEEIRDVSNQISNSKAKARLIVSAPASITTGWLSHRIGEYMSDNDTADISLRSDNDPAEFNSHQIDIRMSFGRFHYRTHDTFEIDNDKIFAVCAPQFMQKHGSAPIQDLPLIHTDWGMSSATFATWRDWFDAENIPIVKQVNSGIIADSSMAAINLAVNGLGVCLSQGLMIERLLRSGDLVLAQPHVLSQSQPYCLTIPQRSANRPVVLHFRDWLVRACKQDILGSREFLEDKGSHDEN